MTVSLASPRLILVAGANGAGKSSLTRRWVRRFGARLGTVLDPDEVARRLNPQAPAQAAIRAARTVLTEVDRLIAQRERFLVETTLSDRNRHLELLDRAHASGYRVWVLYVGLDSAALHARRVAERVGLGGHDVPAKDILRRHSRSLKNAAATLSRADRAFVYDNSGLSMRLVASLEAGRVRFSSGVGWWSGILSAIQTP